MTFLFRNDLTISIKVPLGRYMNQTCSFCLFSGWLPVNLKPTLTWSNHNISPKEIFLHNFAVTSHDTADLIKYYMLRPLSLRSGWADFLSGLESLCKLNIIEPQPNHTKKQTIPYYDGVVLTHDGFLVGKSCLQRLEAKTLSSPCNQPWF